MRFLITNDDGIYAPGLSKLAEAAGRYGEVYVAAPSSQCSAMAHSVTIRGQIRVEEVSDFSAPCKKAYAIGGTPADCVKVAVEFLMEQKPDWVLSGINKGYNAGMDIAYSGTVAAAMEALMKGIPAMAFSKGYDEDYRLVDAKLGEILGGLINKSAGTGRIWNVNFPEGGDMDCRGTLWGQVPAKAMRYPDVYRVVGEDECTRILELKHELVHEFEEGTDLNALARGYISIGTVTSVLYH